MEFQNILKAERAKQNLSQTELATKLHVARQTVSKWETGQSYPNLDVLISISEILNISTDKLLKGENNIVAENISNDVKAKSKYKKLFIGLMILFSIIFLGGITLLVGNYAQISQIDKINPFLKTTYGYAEFPVISKNKSSFEVEVFDGFPFDSQVLNVDLIQPTDKKFHYAIIKHKGSYIYNQPVLIEESQVPAPLKNTLMPVHDLGGIPRNNLQWLVH